MINACIWENHPYVDEPGIYLGVPAAIYHSDPCPEPSLSSSIARLCLRSLKKAKAKHPRLAAPIADDEEPITSAEPKIAMDIGSAAHSMAFGFGAEVVVFPYKNWTTNRARYDKRVAREGGQIPLLRRSYAIARAMADISGPMIKDLLEGSEVAEAMICWQERGFWRRALIDRMRPDARVIIDLKTTSLDASPAASTRSVFYSGNYFQEAFYRRGLDVLDPGAAGRRRFCFLYQEQEPPFECTLVEVDEAGRTLGDEQVEAACNLWDRALSTGDFPGYPLGPHIASPDLNMLNAWARRTETDETLNTPYLPEEEE